MPRTRDDGQMKGKKKERSPGRIASGFGKSLWWDLRWRKKDYGTSPRRECGTIEEHCPEKREVCTVNTKIPSSARRKLSQQLAAGECGWRRGEEEEAA